MNGDQKHIPAYSQVAARLRESIASGEYPVGTLIPTEPQLELIYGVSRTTIRRAVSLLAQEGLLRVQQGRGTEVMADKPHLRFTDVIDFQEIMSFDLSDSQILQMNIDKIPVPGENADALCLSSGSPVFRIQRIMGYHNMPYQIITNYVPEQLTPGLEAYAGKFVSLYPFLQEKYGLEFHTAVEEISAGVAEFMEAQVLHINTGAPVFRLSRTAQCNQGPLECSYSTIRADQYKLKVTMNTLYQKVHS